MLNVNYKEKIDQFSFSVGNIRCTRAVYYDIKNLFRPNFSIQRYFVENCRA